MQPNDLHDLLRAVVDGLPAIIWIKDLEGVYLYVNRHSAEVMGTTPEAIVGKRDVDLFPPEVIAEWRGREAQIRRSGQPVHSEDTFGEGGEARTYVATLVPLKDERGELRAFAGISTDVTPSRHAEAERARLQDALIKAQQEALEELALPVIPVSDQVLVMPLIGPIDSNRAEQIVESLLDKVGEQRARVAIIDLTGVRVVDSAVASTLVRATDAVRLLGAQVVLTGIRPEVAETIVRLGLDTRRFAIRGTLMDGIRFAMERDR